jgi:hypothetical protein
MDTTGLKTFAQEARTKLRREVGNRLDYWLGADSAEHRQFAPQIKELKDALEKEGREPLVERVAYTWFNRLAALRFMDANGYHPFGVRVVTPATEQQTMPELLQEARAGSLDAGLRAELPTPDTYDLLIAERMPIDNPIGEAYRLLLFAVCHYYQGLMPFLFERLGDATELLLPGDLLTEHSILADFREALADDDCREVEVIGWLYQFYISEKKAAVMARNAAVPKEDIPAVTQLFTPHWIVRYLVENSLGRLWLLNRPRSRLREHMPYYIEGEPETDFLKIEKPEHIRLLDPAVGSAHMLTYAFDLLYLIYEEEGYDASEIPSLILRHNLHGIEICDRAAALAAFALCMKARSRDKRFFRRLANGGADVPLPHIIELTDVRFAENELRDYIRALGLGDLFNQPVLKLLHQFEEAKNFGSLIQPSLDERAIADLRRAIEAKDLGGQLFLRETHLKVLRVLEQAEALTQRYHVVVANPPYMGSGQMNASLATFVGNTLSEGKADMYAAFILRNLALVMRGGKVGMITIPNWMFLSSFEELRGKLLSSSAVSSLIHCGRGIWGSDFGSCAFILSHTRGLTGRGEFRRLFQKTGEVQSVQEIEANFLDRKTYRPYLVAPEDFRKITGFPFAYWVGKYDIFDLPLLSGRVVSGGRIKTHDGPRFIRFHWEIPRASSRWRLFLKGGEFRKFYGNENYVVDWSDEAVAFYGEHGGLIRNEFRAKEGICWSKITVSLPSFRLKRQECEYDSASPTIFTHDFRCDFELLGYLNSKVGSHVLGALNPTVNTQVADVLALPFAELKGDSKGIVVEQTRQAVSLARSDWDNFETSWDFRDQPLLRPGLKGATLEASWRNWEAQSTAAIRRMQELETENNRLFIAAYGLDRELQPEVPEAQITLARAEARKDAAALISYAVGCMMGRYSLDQPGLILADAGATAQDYLAKVPSPTFAPDADGILPLLDDDWFPDDVVTRTEEFIRVVWGRERERENVAWLEKALGKVDKKTGKTKPTDLRSWFVREFYANHLSNERAYGYKKRPIYWLVSSPEGSFQALIYLHRYTKDTVNLLLDRYVRVYIHKLEAHEKHLTGISLDETARPSERTTATKDIGRIQKMIRELKEWDRSVVLPLAQQRIELDLDDGVKANYLKFPGLLAKIPGLEKKEED